MKTQYYHSDNERDTHNAAKQIAEQLTVPACVHVTGDLGTGKTTLIRSIAECMGYKGAVTSPTYNLIHEYPIKDAVIYHMDLYRVDNPQELEYLALADIWSDDSIFLVEWPEKGGANLPPATHEIDLRKESSTQTQKRAISFCEKMSSKG